MYYSEPVWQVFIFSDLTNKPKMQILKYESYEWEPRDPDTICPLNCQKHFYLSEMGEVDAR